MSVEEWLDLNNVIKKLENAVKRAFGSELINLACNMNVAYQSSEPKPHVHWYFRPRYSCRVEFENLNFHDEVFGYSAKNIEEALVDDEMQNKIAKKIRDYI